MMKAMFHWVRRNDIIETIPNIGAISKGKIVNQEKFTWLRKYCEMLYFEELTGFKPLCKGREVSVLLNVFREIHGRWGNFFMFAAITI